MKIYSKAILLILISMTGLQLNCGLLNGDDGSPLLSFLTNNRMIIILKGTYASDRPLGFDQINNNTLFVDADDDTDTTAIPTYSNLPMYLDIGEIRLSTKSFMQELPLVVQDADDSEDFWDIASTERQVYCSQLYVVDAEHDSCMQTGGLINYVEFMNGRGAVFPSREVGPGTYTHAGIFMRSFSTGYARAGGAVQSSTFDSSLLSDAWNILPQVQYDPGTDAVNQQILTPQWFPLHGMTVWGQQNQMTVDSSRVPFVLEIRSNIKENLMVHSFTNSNSVSQTFVGFSDWKVNHENTTDNDGIDQGGNVLTRARIFYPDFVSDMRICCGSDTFSSRYYYAIDIQNICDPGTYSGNGLECNAEDQLPLAATPVRSNDDNTLKDLQSGSYTLQCRYDSDNDGYPETVVRSRTFELLGLNAAEALVRCDCGEGLSSPVCE